MLKLYKSSSSSSSSSRPSSQHKRSSPSSLPAAYLHTRSYSSSTSNGFCRRPWQRARRRRRRPGRRLPGQHGGQVQDRRVARRRAHPGHGACGARVRDGHLDEPGDVPRRRAPPLQRQVRQHRHQLHGHAQPPRPRRRLPRRRQARPLPHHRHLRHHRRHRRQLADGGHDGAWYATAGVLGRPGRTRARVRAGERRATGAAVRGAVHGGGGRRRAEGERVRVRVGPVRLAGPAGGARHGFLLQPLLLLHQPGVALRGHRAGVRAGQRREGVGIRRLRRRHGARRRGVRRRHDQVQVPAAPGEPAHGDREGARHGVEEAEAAAPRRRRRAHRIPRGQGGIHRSAQVPRQGGDRGDRPVRTGGEAAAGVGDVDGDGGGGGEDGGEAAAHLVHVHPLLDRVLPDDHLLCRAGHPHGSPPPSRRRLGLRHPGGVPLRVPLPLHPPLHLPQRAPPRAGHQPPHGPPKGAHLAAARRHGPRPRRRRHGRRGARREETPRRVQRRGRRGHQRLLAGAAVLPGRRRRGVRVRRPAGVLHPGGPRADEVHEHGALPGDALHGLLPQQLPRLRRRRRDAGHVDPKQPRRREAGPLLRDAGGARRCKLRRVPGVREATRVQAQHRGSGGGASRRGGRRRQRWGDEGDGRPRRGQGGRRRDGRVGVASRSSTWRMHALVYVYTEYVTSMALGFGFWGSVRHFSFSLVILLLCLCLLSNGASGHRQEVGWYCLTLFFTV